MANTVDKVLKTAKAEVGYLEKSKAAYTKNPKILDSKTQGAGYDNYTKYGRDMHKIYPSVMDFPAAWCDCFVDWCFYKSYGVATAKSLIKGNFNDYTVASAQMYMNKKAYHYAPKEAPKKGDQIFFKNTAGGICHTGLVTDVKDGYVYTIEGNTSSTAGVVANGGGVFTKRYPLSYNRIHGYGRPKYDKKEVKGEIKQEAVKIEVKQPAPTPAPKKDEPEPLKMTTKNVVTADKLNIRKTADSSNSKNIVGSYLKGKEIVITGVAKNGDWYKTKDGYVSSDYISSKKAIVTANELKIRKEKSGSAEQVGVYKKGKEVSVLALTGSWALTPRGYVASKYLKKKG